MNKYSVRLKGYFFSLDLGVYPNIQEAVLAANEQYGKEVLEVFRSS